MAWITFTSVSVSNGGLTATVNSAEDISLLEINAGLIIGELAPVAIKKAYLGAGNSKVIELFAPWPHATQTNKAARVFNTDAGLPEATKALNDVTDLVKGDFKEVIEVSEHLSEITTVATNINSVVTAANSSAKIVTVADNISHVVNTANNMAAVIAAPTEAAKAKAEADKSAASAASALSEANRAKTEADNAKVSADAAKVSETNASNAAGDSHSPLPDVWIPFSDNLKMITGYGSDVVRIGEDTIKIAGENNATFTRASTATYIDKSGVLRTAGINEPRFEEEGLLIEGQSTNYVANSEGYVFTTTPASSVKRDGEWHVLSKIADGAAYMYTGSSPEIPVAPVLCISYEVKFNNIDMASSAHIRHSCRLDGTTTYVYADFDKATKEVVFKHPTLVSASMASLGNDIWKVEIVLPCTVQSSSNRFLYVSLPPAHGGYPFELYRVRRLQVEPLPFATSYIPTSGAAVTRAAEKLVIPKANNNCVAFYSGSVAVAPTATATELEFATPTGKKHLRNVKGFMTALTAAQIAALK